MEKTDAEWRASLTPEQYEVLRGKGTERAFSGAFWDAHDEAMYTCAGCGAELFSSDTKFDSGTGWPSFTAPMPGDPVEADGRPLARHDAHGGASAVAAAAISATCSTTGRDRRASATASTRRRSASYRRASSTRIRSGERPQATSPGVEPVDERGDGGGRVRALRRVGVHLPGERHEDRAALLVRQARCRTRCLQLLGSSAAARWMFAACVLTAIWTRRSWVAARNVAF